MPVTVKWGKDRFQFELPPQITKIAAIRQSIAAYTQLPYASFDIVHDGALMKDDTAPISAYHLRPNSTIAIVAAASHPQQFINTEQSQIATIQSELASLHTALLPAHASLLADLHHRQKSSLSKEHSRVSELLLQALLRIDGIVPERDWDDARAQRKAAVKQLQSLLDELDAAWADTTQ
ncbi:hypothetical protein B0H34DRAFT_795639 [Crassisporium funariophilum]|nr:hypothetical protein B0H34DRAFT_795639 [Crassisporium funariophilum]